MHPPAPPNHPRRSATKTGTYDDITRQIAWQLGASATAADSAFVIDGQVTVGTLGQKFKSLVLRSAVAEDKCEFTGPACSPYNDNTAPLATSADCPYRCTVPAGAAGGTRNITVDVIGTDNTVKQSQSATVPFNAPTVVVGDNATISDPYLKDNSDWMPVDLQATTTPVTTFTWTAATFVTCADCATSGVTAPATVTTNDGQTATAPGTAALTCSCSLDVAVNGAGSYSRAWTW